MDDDDAAEMLKNIHYIYQDGSDEEEVPVLRLSRNTIGRRQLKGEQYPSLRVDRRVCWSCVDTRAYIPTRMRK